MAGGESQQTDTQTINYFSVTYATANFTTPSPTADTSGNLLSGILTTATSQNAVASITAMVSEPLSNGKTNTSTCSATTTINLADVVTITP
jgi:hypothetical protein